MSTDVLIYCNGDSFVNGHELGDSLISSYPGCCNFDEYKADTTKKMLEWYQNSFDTRTDIGIERESKKHSIMSLQKRLAFPNVIQEKTNYTVINAAINTLGNSQGSITRRSITDLHELRKKYKKIIAIISTTSNNRLDLPNTDGDWTNFMLTNYPPPISYADKMLRKLMKYYLLYATEYHMLVEWYKNIALLQNYCKVHNIPLLLVTGVPKVDLGEYKNKDDLEALREIVNLKYEINFENLAKEIQYNVMCPGFHFGPNVHSKAADLLIERIQQEL